MNTLFKLCALLLAMSLLACSHTLEGIGKDLQEWGKSIEDSSKE